MFHFIIIVIIIVINVNYTSLIIIYVALDSSSIWPDVDLVYRVSLRNS